MINKMNIFASYIDEVNNNLYSALLERVSREKKQKAMKFHRLEDSISTMVGELLLKHGLRTTYGINIDINNIPIQMGKYGKPYLPQNLGISFNISHSGKWVVCALSNDEVGIDIEKISFDLDIDVSKYFHKNESKIVNSLLGKPKYYSFYRFWTAKESYLKCTGRGLSQPLNSFYVHNGFIYDKHNRKTQYQIDYYHVAQGYQAALCHIKNTTVARKNISLVKICDLFATIVIR